MTTSEIKRKIKELQALLNEEEDKIENQKDETIGKYYKSGDAIGKFMKTYNLSENTYIGNEIYFMDTEYTNGKELIHDTNGIIDLDNVEILTEEEFRLQFDYRINQFRKSFISK